MNGQSARTAIVTGAARRVGAAIAEALLADDWTVVAHVHHANDDVPKGAHKIVADLADPASAARIIAAADGHAPLRLLVNNAARFAWDGPGEFSASEFGSHMAVNLRAPVALADGFAAAQDGEADSLIVNLVDSKVAAPNPDYLSYTLSKMGLADWTRLAARAFAARRVRVNGIAPALILQSSGQSAENYRSMHDHNPLRRGVEPADVIAALRYLIDAQTMTGQVLILDSGQHFMALDRDVQFLGDR
ncbi:MAG: SDR family oxidoreductase [Sphingomonas sp.]|nr:SDR family oxidoreductase [Sphingomonas sp.]